MERTRPVRLQLSRKRGFNLQSVSVGVNGLFAVNVARPSRWGNPYVVKFDPHPDYSPQTRAEAVKLYMHMINGRENEIRAQLRGKNLACWCPPGVPCHADVLLEIANK